MPCSRLMRAMISNTSCTSIGDRPIEGSSSRDQFGAISARPMGPASVVRRRRGSRPGRCAPSGVEVPKTWSYLSAGIARAAVAAHAQVLAHRHVPMMRRPPSPKHAAAHASAPGPGWPGLEADRELRVTLPSGGQQPRDGLQRGALCPRRCRPAGPRSARAAPPGWRLAAPAPRRCRRPRCAAPRGRSPPAVAARHRARCLPVPVPERAGGRAAANMARQRQAGRAGGGVHGRRGVNVGDDLEPGHQPNHSGPRSRSSRRVFQPGLPPLMVPRTMGTSITHRAVVLVGPGGGAQTLARLSAPSWPLAYIALRTFSP